MRQPVFQEGQLAARKLLSLLQGHSAEDLETLQSTLVVRESCGVEVRAPDRPVQAAATRREAPPAAHLSSPVREALEQAFRVSLLDEGNQDFLSLWRATVITAVHTEGGAGEWADFLNSLTERVRAELPDAPQERFGQLTLRATQMVLDGVHNLRVTLRSQEEQRSLRVARMFATRTSDDLFTAVGEYLDHLKVRRYILALYEPYSQAPAPSARVVLGQGTGVPVDRAPFPSSSLLPSSMASELQRGSVMVAPLYAGDLQFGYLLYDRPDALADEREGILRLYFDDETPLRMISHALLYQHERARTERHAAELEQQVHRRTEQLREANDHLQHSEGRFRSLVQNASDLIMVLDAHLRVLYVSPAVEVVFGHAAPAMLGQQVLDHLPADQHHGVREVVADLVSSGLGSNVRTEFQVLNAAREARWLEGRVTNLLTDPHVQGLVVNARDITEQIRTREALSVSQQQLMSSERLASLGRLTAGLAHEINTPLAATMNYLHVARGLVQEYQGSIGHAGVTDADHQEIASETLAALNEAGKTTARIGEFIRQMRGHTRDTVSGVGSFDPFKLASDTLTMVAHEARAAQVDLHLEFYPLPLRLRGEPGRFTQVLTNLVINAIHACEGRAGARRVDVRFLEQQGGVDLQVQDNGSGIAPEVIGHIFDAMFTTKEAGKGTGLGLAILHDIVHGHFGGTTEVQTEVGTGTVFTVRFPAREGAAQAG
ncbi:sensor histidine kinase [Deinococcus sonorensis]|uniref:histidine kinase n=1 Tax=Deinococcus sonorensis KR-87 TaxID=694439 RepID=A0AAU7U5Q6_9DEIO